MKLLERIESINCFSESERCIIQFLLQNKDMIMYMSSEEVAKETHASLSSIYRLCHKLGIKGYKQLQIELASENYHIFKIQESNRIIDCCSI